MDLELPELIMYEGDVKEWALSNLWPKCYQSLFFKRDEYLFQDREFLHKESQKENVK